MQKVNYLNNKDILKEIHRSKKTYCSYISDEYYDYDYITEDKSEITPELIQKLREDKAKPSKGKPATPIEEIDPESIVIRVMTYEHIPIDEENGKKNKLTGIQYAKTNFHPFRHFILKNDGELKEVARSHWIGGFDNGHFSASHGKMTHKLSKMFIMLSERYANRPNWRGYCVDKDTQALTQRGWLSHDEITEEDIVLSYNEGSLTWSKIKSIYRDANYSGKMFKLTSVGLDALVTPNHKFVTKAGIKPVEHLLEKDSLILMGDAVNDTDEIYSDDFVKLVGWFVTEGNIYVTKTRKYPRMFIYQNEGTYANDIRSCLINMNSKFGETKRNKNICFTLTKDICLKINDVMENYGNKVMKNSFIMNLSLRQRNMLLDVMIKADGWNNTQGDSNLMRFAQKDRDSMDRFVTLCTLCGYRTSVTEKNIISFGKETRINIATVFSPLRNLSTVENINFNGGKNRGTIIGQGKATHPNIPTEDYSGMVWCVSTEYGSFICRRNNKVHLTGNSYVDEMKSYTLLHLSQIGLQFNEAKSDNPFAFYTTSMTNCFKRIANEEKKNQMIRDDLITMHGLTPSYTRQTENDMGIDRN